MYGVLEINPVSIKLLFFQTDTSSPSREYKYAFTFNPAPFELSNAFGVTVICVVLSETAEKIRSRFSSV